MFKVFSILAEPYQQLLDYFQLRYRTSIQEDLPWLRVFYKY